MFIGSTPSSHLVLWSGSPSNTLGNSLRAVDVISMCSSICLLFRPNLQGESANNRCKHVLAQLGHWFVCNRIEDDHVTYSCMHSTLYRVCETSTLKEISI